MWLFKKYLIIFHITFVCVVLRIQNVLAFEPSAMDFKCAKQCTCARQSFSDVPTMKWLTIPMNKISNDTLKMNSAIDADDDLLLSNDPLIFSAFCVQQDNSSTIIYQEFTPAIEALTLLYGPDTLKKTIEYELAEFSELVVLDIQGYQPKTHLTREHSELQLHYNALLRLHNLRYLNIERTRLFPFSNATHQDLSSGMYSNYFSNQSAFRTNPNLTFLTPNDAEIIPYEEYKKRKNITSTFSQLIDLQFLRLFDCYIDVITWDMFDGLFNLRMLSLQNNHIVELPEYAFYSMPELRSLILSENKIQRIHNESLAGLFHLENLDLSGNQLKILSDMTFAPLPKLHSFNLLNNPLEFIFSSTFEIANLTRNLWIGSTDTLVVYEDAFSSLNQLEKLVLLGLNTSVLQKGVLRGLSQLKYFRLSGNVEHLNFDTFTGSLLLEELILRRCSLKSISVDAFYGLDHLKRLDISRNKLQTLQPGVFDQLYSLKELILAHNQFVTLPKLVLANLQYVEMIRLEANPWNCSCDMVDWGLLNLDKKKEKKIVEQSCSYQYDKVPCTSVQTDSYIHDPKAMPRCVTPNYYKGRSVLHTVYTHMECAGKKAISSKKYSRLRNIEGKKVSSRKHIIEQTIVMKNSETTSEDNENQDVNNNLENLSNFLSSNNVLYQRDRGK